MRATQGFWSSILSSLLLVVTGLALVAAISDLTFTSLAGSILSGLLALFAALPPVLIIVFVVALGARLLNRRW